MTLFFIEFLLLFRAVVSFRGFAGGRGVAHPLHTMRQDGIAEIGSHIPSLVNLASINRVEELLDLFVSRIAFVSHLENSDQFHGNLFPTIKSTLD